MGLFIVARNAYLFFFARSIKLVSIAARSLPSSSASTTRAATASADSLTRLKTRPPDANSAASSAFTRSVAVLALPVDGRPLPTLFFTSVNYFSSFGLADVSSILCLANEHEEIILTSHMLRLLRRDDPYPARMLI